MRKLIMLLCVLQLIQFNTQAQNRPLPEQLPVSEEDMPIPCKIVFPDSLHGKVLSVFITLTAANPTINTPFGSATLYGIDSTFVYNVSPSRTYHLLIIASNGNSFDNEIKIPAVIFNSQAYTQSGKPILRKR